MDVNPGQLYQDFSNQEFFGVGNALPKIYQDDE
jgi:hypothetical protein